VNSKFSVEKCIAVKSIATPGRIIVYKILASERNKCVIQFQNDLLFAGDPIPLTKKGEIEQMEESCENYFVNPKNKDDQTTSVSCLNN
jgi:hypothetical protein